MEDSLDQRTFLVGQLLCGMSAKQDAITDADIKYAIYVADKTIEAMTWPDGKPERLMMGGD